MGEFPSKRNQFKKGQSGNPDGRPQGSRSLIFVLRRYLQQELEFIDPITKKEAKRQVGDIIVLQLVGKAIRGDERAIREILDRVEGKASGDPMVTNIVNNVQNRTERDELDEDSKKVREKMQNFLEEEFKEDA